MQLILADTTEVKLKKTLSNRKGDITFAFTVKVNHPKETANGDNINDNDVASNLMVNVVGQDTSDLRVDLDPLGSGQYALEVWSLSNKGLNFVKNLREQFPDIVLISLEITEGNDDGKKCVSTKMMVIDENGRCEAHSSHFYRFNLDLLSKHNTFHVKIIAHIYVDAYVLRKTTQKILDESVASDVVIQAGNGAEIGSHKCFLISISSVFKRMFASEMTESKIGRIEMPDISEEGLRAFLRYIYQGEVIGPKEDVKVAYELIYAAQKYDIPSLVASMKAYLVKREDDDFSVDLAFKIYSFVRGIENATEVKNKMARVMSFKYDEVKELPEFKEVFQKNSGNALEICEDLVKARPIPPPTRNLDYDSSDSD